MKQVCNFAPAVVFTGILMKRRQAMTPRRFFLARGGDPDEDYLWQQHQEESKAQEEAANAGKPK